jgi:ComF family protein
MLCLNSLPKTDFHLNKENPVAEIFWGKVQIHAATAYYYFNKGSKVQYLIHQLKYKGRREIGIFIGEQMGNELKQSEFFKNIDLIIPVPLHPKKERKRGYNQSEMFGLGLAKSLKIPLSSQFLVRKEFTDTQTKKSRSDRWKNVENVFAIKNQESLAGKHILLVDDVITTGSTLEACIRALSEIENVTISVSAIATGVGL